MRLITNKIDEHSKFVERSYQLRTTSYQLIILVLLAIAIGSCYSIESDCVDDGGGIPIDPGPLPPIDSVPLPGNGFWEYTIGPPSSAELIAVASNGDLWAGVYNSTTLLSTIYLSTDNGDTWVQKVATFQFLILSLVINPINGYIFVRTPNTLYGELFRSTDNGENWEKVAFPSPITGVFIIPSGEIYIGTFSGVYYSNDNGDTWINKSNGLSNQTISSLALGKDATLYVGMLSGGVYRSTNGGDTWLPPSSYTNVSIKDITVSDDGSIFVATDGAGVLKSTDRGVTWTQVNTGLPIDYSSYQISKIIYNPITRDIFVITYNSAIYRSSDLGESWELKNIGIPNGSNIKALAFNPNTGQMYAATGGGVYRSRNYPEPN
jgi:photosystem II stability/assembly factor-like uncharacterized protein